MLNELLITTAHKSPLTLALVDPIAPKQATGGALKIHSSISYGVLSRPAGDAPATAAGC